MLCGVILRAAPGEQSSQCALREESADLFYTFLQISLLFPKSGVLCLIIEPAVSSAKENTRSWVLQVETP